MIGIRFTPWRKFNAYHDKPAVKRWLHVVADRTEETFKSGMGSYPPASSPGSYPSKRTGNLHGSIRKRVTDTEAEVGSNMFYSIFLRAGTSKMARRKMSDDALKEALPGARSSLGHFARWRRG